PSSVISTMRSRCTLSASGPVFPITSSARSAPAADGCSTKRQSSAQQRRQRLAGRSVHLDGRPPVEGRRPPVDDRKRPACRERLVGKPRDGIDLERGADDEQQSGGAGKLGGPLHRLGR